MDEMKINLHTKVMKKFVSKILMKVLSKKLGLSTNLIFEDLAMKKIDDKICFHVNAYIDIDEKDLLKITKILDEEDLADC